MTALLLTAEWPVPNVSAAVLRGGELVEVVGDTAREFALASVTKPIVAWAILVAVEEGVLDLDEEIADIGQPGCTMRHLLSHAGGFPFDGHEPIGLPERTRGYSNAGIEIAAETLGRASGIDVATYLSEAVLHPLSMTSTRLVGSPAHGGRSCVDDMVRFVREIMAPVLVSQGTRDEAFVSTYPELSGIVPGVGRYAPCPWGLGFEIRGHKSPHWTGRHNSPRAVGHFGGAGTMFWYDANVAAGTDLALVALTDEPFGPWALEAWPVLSDAVLAEYAP